MTDSEDAPAPGRRGRPPGKRGTFTFRVTSELRGRLEAAAAASERPVSEEIERRLERSFESHDLLLSYFGSSETLKLAQAIAALAQTVEAATGSKWTEDQETRHSFSAAIERFAEIYLFEQGISRKFSTNLEPLGQSKPINIGHSSAEQVAVVLGLRSTVREHLAAWLATSEGQKAMREIEAKAKAGGDAAGLS